MSQELRSVLFLGSLLAVGLAKIAVIVWYERKHR